MVADREMSELLTVLRRSVEELTRTVAELSVETAGLQAEINKRALRITDSVAEAAERLAAEAAELGIQALRDVRGLAGSVRADRAAGIGTNTRAAILAGLGLLITLGVIFPR